VKTLLMLADRDFQLTREEQIGEQDLIQDLELETLWQAMAGGDEIVYASARSALLSGLTTVEQIRYRQQVLADCLRQPAIVREMYGLALQAIAEKKKSWRGIGISSKNGEALLRDSMRELEMFVRILKQLRKLTEDHGAEFSSEGFTRFFDTLRRELDDDYFDEIAHHLRQLRVRDGVLTSAQLGEQSQGVGYVLRTPRHRANVLHVHPTVKKPAYSLTIPRTDDAGGQALAGLRDRALSLAANALAQSADHILSFFAALRSELGFYVGCLNLHEQLAAKHEPKCIPEPESIGTLVRTARGLYDPCLSLHLSERVQGNDLDADNKQLIILTGANQGGKSTFLRSLGVAQLMMQAGMFVAAESFSATVAHRVFTHYKREEDASMTRGKFDEELQRMSEIGKHISPHCLLICNESLAATNEREAAEIATEIIRAMNHVGITVAYVTHLYELSHHFYQHHTDTTLFLRADRGSDGHRPFHITEGKPLPTSYSEDLYRRTFGTSDGASLPNLLVDSSDLPAELAGGREP
jgi:DNA mismatch repair ATPase MutS